MSCLRCQGPIERGELRCAGCGLATPAPAEPAPAVSILRCRSCGVGVNVARAASTGCAFCGGTLAPESVTESLDQAATGLPFVVTAAEALAAFRRWNPHRGLDRPRGLASLQREGLRAIHVAAWACDLEAEVAWSGDSPVGRIKADRAPHAGTGTLELSGLIVSASRGLDVEALVALTPDPFDLAALQPPPADGVVLVERFELEPFEARARAAQRLVVVARERVAPSHLFDYGREVRVVVRTLARRRVLLPVWVMAYRHRGESYRVVVSGQDATRIAGTAPCTYRVLKLTLLLLIPYLGGLAAIIASDLPRSLAEPLAIGIAVTVPLVFFALCFILWRRDRGED